MHACRKDTAIEGDREKCLEAGMNDYLTKPIQKETLFATMKRFIPLPREEKTGTVPSAATDAKEDQNKPPDLSIFNTAEAIDRYDGDLDVLKMIIDNFTEDTPKTIDDIASAVDAGKAAEAGSRAHALKGGASYIGAERIRELALAIEIAGKKNNLKASSPLLSELRNEFELFESEIAAFDWKGGGER